MIVDPFSRLERLQKMLADELAVPIRDAAGIINPKGVDSAHRAVGMQRMLNAITEDSEEVTPWQKP